MEEIGIMQTRMGWLALLLSAGMALAPTAVRGQPPIGTVSQGHNDSGPAREPAPMLVPTTFRAQMLDYEVPQADPVFPVPLYSPRPELGGFFFNGEFIYWRQTNPLRDQPVAVRGSVPIAPGLPLVGQGFRALDVEQVSGPVSYVPGYRMGLGYRFRNGVVVEGNYTHMFNVRYVAAATLMPPFEQIDPALLNTVLFSPV